MNRCWRIFGSTIWPMRIDLNPPLPRAELFMRSRMADRPGPPTYSTKEPDIWTIPPIPASTPMKVDTGHNRRRIEQRPPVTEGRRPIEAITAPRKIQSRKRGLQSVLHTENTNTEHKHKRRWNERLIATTAAITGKGNTPRPRTPPSKTHTTPADKTIATLSIHPNTTTSLQRPNATLTMDVPKPIVQRASLQRSGTYNTSSYFAVTKRFNCPISLRGTLEDVDS